MEASPLGSIIDNRAKPPAGLPGFVLTRDRGTRPREPSAVNELSNFADSAVSSFSRGWKVSKIILIDNCISSQLKLQKNFWNIWNFWSIIIERKFKNWKLCSGANWSKQANRKSWKIVSQSIVIYIISQIAFLPSIVGKFKGKISSYFFFKKKKKEKRYIM